MKNMKKLNFLTLNKHSAKTAALCLALAGTGLLTGCGSDDDAVQSVSYEITVTNLSNNQPLSPLAALLHDGEYKAWSVGASASSGLEYLAEGGDNSTFISDDAAMLMDSASGAAPVGPGASDTLIITRDGLTSEMASVLSITLASMLVNTNDGFTGMTGLDVSALDVGDTVKHYLPIYDAGTEANDELAGTIPGPADGGEGYNASRGDVDYVARHPGVVSKDDGYSSSVLDASHRFDSPIAKLVVKRLQ